MEALALIFSLVLSVVFAAAGIGKLTDAEGTRRALAGFGAPAALVPPLAIALPVAELAVSLALLPVASAWFGAIGALCLLLLFVCAIAVNLLLGRRPDCHCFGRLHSAPAGWPMLVQNSALACAAGLIVFIGQDHPGASVVGWYHGLTVTQRLVAFIGGAVFAVLVANGMVLFQILRQQGRILLRLDVLGECRAVGVPFSASQAQPGPPIGLPVGAQAPEFRLPELTGEIVSLEALTDAAKPVLLIFTNPRCGPCQALLPDVGRWQRDHSSAATTALVTEGAAEENRAKCSTYGIAQVLLQHKREVAEAYQAWGTPAAVLIRPDRTIASPVAQGVEAVRGLAAQALVAAPGFAPADAPGTRAGGRQGVQSAMRVADLAPPLVVSDVDGNFGTLTDFLWRETLLLFWNPRCGFCRRMLDDLKRWETEPPPGAPALLVVSAGAIEDIRAMQLRSPIVLDDNSQVAIAFGATGTPMGVLIDDVGRIASEVVAGAQAVMAMANMTARTGASADSEVVV